MRRKNVRRMIALLMAAAFVLTACGSSKMETPELIEPKASLESYRTIEYGNIGSTDLILYGTVVPTEHCHFWNATVEIAEINVDIGDTVNAGDVLAVADLDAVNEVIESINSEIALTQTLKTEEDKKFELKKQELEFKLLGCQETGDSDGADAANTELAILYENHNFDNLLYQHRISNMTERVSEQQEIIEDGTLIARTSGRVSYVKDLSTNNQVTGAENIVVIADYDDCYVEVKDKLINDRVLFTQYPICYTTVGGKKYDLVEYPYSQTEMLQANSRSKYAPLRLKFADDVTMPATGSSVPVMLQKIMIENVLVVGNDALSSNEKGDFVYIKQEDSKEVRYVELGTADKYNTEVISGLSEGEKVYYTSDSPLPDDYVEYPVEISKYVAQQYTNAYSFENTQKLRHYSDYEGQVVDVQIKEGEEVSKGDLICTIKTNEGSAALKEMSNAITNLKDSHNKTIKAYDAQIEELENQIAEALLNKNKPQEPDPVPDTATDTDANPEEPSTTEPSTTEPSTTEPSATEPSTTEPNSTEQDTKIPSPYLYEELNCKIEQIKIDKKITEIDYNHQLKIMDDDYTKASCNNDGSGSVMIYADYSGKITDTVVKPGKKIKIGERICNIEIPANKKVVIKLNQPMSLDQPITFTEEKTGRVFTGKVTGNAGFSPETKYYITTINEKVYITENLSSMSGSTDRYYVTMDDETFFDSNNKCIVGYSDLIIDHTVVFPKGIVKTEINIYNADEELHYIWKIVDGELVKQYVNAIYHVVNNTITFCVLGGLNEGDIVARDKSALDDEEEDTKPAAYGMLIQTEKGSMVSGK